MGLHVITRQPHCCVVLKACLLLKCAYAQIRLGSSAFVRMVLTYHGLERYACTCVDAVSCI